MQPRHQERGIPGTGAQFEARWTKVMSWPGLTGEAKLAWYFMALHRAGGRVDCTIAVHKGELGTAQGTSDRAGERCLERLRDRGLVEFHQDGRGGPYTVYLCDPFETEKARLRKLDPQRELFESADVAPDPPNGPKGESADVAPDPPKPERVFPMKPQNTPAAESADVAPHPPNPTYTFNVSDYVKDRNVKRNVEIGGSGATSADSTDPPPALPAEERRLLERIRDRQREPGAPPALGDVLTSTADRLAGFQAAKEPARLALIERIRGVVADPELAAAVCDRIARDVVDGAYPEHKLDGILRTVMRERTAERLDHPGRYFIGAMKRSYADAGLPLPLTRPRKPPDTG